MTAPSKYRPVVLHIGAPKTMTTSLQKHFFNKIDGIAYAGLLYADSECFIPSELKDIAIRIQSDMSAWPDQFADNVKAIRAFQADNPVLISDESISEFTVRGPIEKLRFYQDIFGDIKVIFCLRNPLDLLKSLYVINHKGILMGHSGDGRKFLPSFDQWIDILRNSDGKAVLKSFLFSEILEGINDLIGYENILTITFGDLQSEPKKTLSKMCSFIGGTTSPETLDILRENHENIRPTKRLQLYVKLRKYLFPGRSIPLPISNALRRQFNSFLKRGPELSPEPGEETAEYLQEFYSDDIQKLAKQGLLI